MMNLGVIQDHHDMQRRFLTFEIFLEFFVNVKLHMYIFDCLRMYKFTRFRFPFPSDFLNNTEFPTMLITVAWSKIRSKMALANFGSWKIPPSLKIGIGRKNRAFLFISQINQLKKQFGVFLINRQITNFINNQ